MKKVLILTLVIMLMFMTGSAQSCLPEGITFQSQAEIDNFHTNYPGCTEIEGFLYVYGGQSSITNLNGLSGITSIGGYLTIYNTDLTGLAGLNSLHTIGGRMEISECNALADLAGLESLISIGSDMVIAFNDNLHDFGGLNSLQSVGGYLYVDGNDNLTNLSALINLTTVNGNVEILHNPSLLGLVGLQGISSFPANLIVTGNAHLLSLAALSGITSIGGNLEIVQNSILPGLTGLESLTTIGGSFQASVNPLVSDFAPLSSLTWIGGNLAIASNPSLTSLEGFSSLTHVGGSLFIEQNFQLTSLSGLDNIDPYLLIDLLIENNHNLSECDIESICQYLFLNPENPWIYIFGNATGCASREEIEAACTVSSDQIEIEASLIVSPNPAINQSWLELKTNLIIEEVEIVDVLGKIISIQCPVGNLIEISELDKGLYLVKVKSENSILIRKLLVF